MQNGYDNQYACLQMVLVLFYWNTVKNRSRLIFSMYFYASFWKRFSFELFQKYVSAAVGKWLASLFQKQKKQSDMFIFSINAKTV